LELSAEPLAQTSVGPTSMGAQFEFDGRLLRVRPQQSPRSEEAAWRLAWFFATRLQQGCLFHASAIRWNGKVAVISGPSGTGKTTLALNAMAAGAELLSDEIVLLLPDGTAYGTPFRSDERCVGQPISAPVALWLTVVHASAERFEPWSPRDAVQLFASQELHEPSYDTQPSMHRVLPVMQPGQAFRFHCRNDLAAGKALLTALEQCP
jgi:hypothetical protein